MMSLGFRVLRLAPLAALLAVGGCFATRSDVRVVQGDIASLRTELLRSDAELREALAQATRTLAAANDSLRVLSTRTVSLQGDVRGETRSIQQQLLQIQSLLGQSQATINRLRAELEQRNSMMPPGQAPPPDTQAAPPTAARGTTDTTAAAGPPALGPSQLYTMGTDQLRRNSFAVARMQFQELLQKFPDSDHAPDARYYIGEAYEREKNLVAADVAYAAVVTSDPNSERAPTALFKRAQIAQQQGNTARAREYANEVVSRYPRSLEADLVPDFLKNLR